MLGEVLTQPLSVVRDRKRVEKMIQSWERSIKLVNTYKDKFEVPHECNCSFPRIGSLVMIREIRGDIERKAPVNLRCKTWQYVTLEWYLVLQKTWWRY